MFPNQGHYNKSYKHRTILHENEDDMMSNDVTRRNFLKSSLAASGGAAIGLSLEEKILLAQMNQSAKEAAPGNAGAKENYTTEMPVGKIGKLQVSRLICGGNLFGGYAHSRDLIYVSRLMHAYLTDEKILETLSIAEKNGFNTVVLNNRNTVAGEEKKDDRALKLLHRYWNECKGKIQWIAQCNPKENDLYSNIQKAIDNGAVAAMLQGGIADGWCRNNIMAIENIVNFIKKKGLVAGTAGHSINVPIECEMAGIELDFYMKTFNSKSYWSAGVLPQNDNMWEESPQETIEFMKSVKIPWIGYKVLGAGAIEPKEGFQYAFENGTDFVCVGMFDFQMRHDSQLVKDIVAANHKRSRPWCG